MVIGTIALNTIFGLMSPAIPQEEAQAAPDHAQGSRHLSSTLTIGRSGSILGYSLLPLVFVSLLGIVIPMDSVFGYLLTSCAIAFSSYSASTIFCAVGRMSQMKLLVLYPLVLFYSVC